MDWSGQIEYAKADWKKFEVDGEEAGLTTGYGPLQFVKVIFVCLVNIHFRLRFVGLFGNTLLFRTYKEMLSCMQFPQSTPSHLLGWSAITGARCWPYGSNGSTQEFPRNALPLDKRKVSWGQSL